MEKQKYNEIFLDVLETNKGIIFKISKAYCTDEEDRKDLVQEIIIQIWNSFLKYDSKYKHSTWIYRIALNVAISNYRKNSTRRNKYVPLNNDTIYIYDDGENNKEEDIVLLYKAIHELNNLDKALVLLHLEGKNHREIAEIMDISESNVSTKLGRIKNRIKERLIAIKNI
jgi:RNA polymerase sigma-70 factor (ECF subfamily)